MIYRSQTFIFIALGDFENKILMHGKSAMTCFTVYIICTCVVQGLWYKTFSVTESETLWIDLPSKLPPPPTKDITPHYAGQHNLTLWGLAMLG